ncbi:hypothetical protein C1I98_15765 [Spongiactinospora gelatinilytica]|uniref:Transposase n=1 Tax=Spongiactinospora gelatinilytica TaxID=2666298 RepID=A0A2W2GAC6_9ACTN|nr:hypothetical protein C1I98_15765 [Spongiactinospora gelatinilytica]
MRSGPSGRHRRPNPRLGTHHPVRRGPHGLPGKGAPAQRLHLHHRRLPHPHGISPPGHLTAFASPGRVDRPDRYPSALADPQWELIKPLLRAEHRRSPRDHPCRQIVNVIVYVVWSTRPAVTARWPGAGRNRAEKTADGVAPSDICR